MKLLYLWFKVLILCLGERCKDGKIGLDSYIIMVVEEIVFFDLLYFIL